MTARPKPLTIEQFGEEMRARVGRGWYPAAVLKIESGQQSMRSADFAAAAAIFHCTIADIMNTTTPVDLGGEGEIAIVPRLDAVMGGDESMPEVVAFAHFERAADALNEQRLAEDRYRHEIGIVRRVLDRDDGISATLRARIDAYERRAQDSVTAEINEMHADDIEHARLLGVEPPARPSALTPAIVACRDALSKTMIPAFLWARRTTKREGER